MKKHRRRVHLSENLTKLEELLENSSVALKSHTRLKSQQFRKRPIVSQAKLLKTPIIIQRTRSFELSPAKKPRSPSPLATGMSLTSLKKLFKARCNDLNIGMMPDQESRFIALCEGHFGERRFYLRDSGLKQQSALIIADILKKSVNFGFVDLSKNALGDIGTLRIAKAISASMTVVHLNINSIGLSPMGSAHVLSTLKDSKCLYSLDISSSDGLNRNRLGKSGAEALRKFISGNEILHFLNVAGTSLGTEGLDCIIQGLKEQSSLETLNISDNGIGISLLAQFFETVNSSDIRELNLSLNELGDESCEFIAEFLVSTPSNVEKLDISRNGISSKGLVHIFGGMSNNGKLTHLNLFSNEFEKGLESKWPDFLIDNTSLVYLNLGKCNLYPEAFRSILALSKNQALQHLVLSSNYLDNFAATMISKALGQNIALKTLDLSENLITSKGGIELAKALAKNTKLEALILKGNALKNSAAKEFVLVSKTNTRLKKIVLAENAIDFGYIQDLQQNLIQNVAKAKRMMVPRLRNAIRKLKSASSPRNNIRSRINIKKKEMTDLVFRCKRQEDRLLEVKGNEEKKLNDLKDELEGHKERNIQLQLDLKEIQKSLLEERIKVDNDIKKKNSEIGLIDSLILSKEQTSNL